VLVAAEQVEDVGAGNSVAGERPPYLGTGVAREAPPPRPPPPPDRRALTVELDTAALLHSAAATRQRRTAGVIDAWEDQYHELLCEELGVRLLLDPSSVEVERCVAGLLRHVLDALAAQTDPFAPYLEAPPEVIALYQEHADPIRSARAAADDELVRLGVAILDLVMTGASSRSTTYAALREAGLPAAPDPTESYLIVRPGGVGEQASVSGQATASP
jgi:hypothetical protein